jgi:hypothetical protein
MDKQQVSTTEYQVSGDQVIAKIKALLHEGNVRRIKLKNREGKTLLDVPVTMGIVGVILAPGWIAIGALALLTPGLTIVVEKYEDKDDAQSQA